jgi:hypothetical protein
MDAALQTQMTIAALVCSALALFFSLVAAFPGLKAVLAAFRDGVLWFALFLVIGGVSFVVWQQVQKLPKPATVGQASSLP